MTMFSGTPFNNVCFPLADTEGGGYDGSAWFSAKSSMKAKNPLINLPYLVDQVGDQEVIITQSNACIAYLGRKLGLWGKTELEMIKCEELLCKIMDLRNLMTGLVYGPTGSDKAALAALIASVAGKNGIFQKLELGLAADSAFSSATPFLVGGHATAPDFHLWELLDQYAKLAVFLGLPPLLTDFPKLADFYKCFAELPASAAYMGSVLHTKLAFNNKMAGFGATLTGELYQHGKEDMVDGTGTF
eukprot:gene20988-27845_t